MKYVKEIALVGAMVLAACASRAENTNVNIIPAPVKLQVQDGKFVLHAGSKFLGMGGGAAKIVATAGAEETAHYLADEMRPALGHELKVVTNSAATSGAILLTTNDAKASLGEE